MNRPMLTVRLLWIALIFVAFAGTATRAASPEYNATLPNCQQMAAAASYGSGLAGIFGKATEGLTTAVDYWSLPPFERGRKIEEKLGADKDLKKNFPGIDSYKKGVATSVKSVDLNAKTYQDPSYLKSRLQKWVDDLKRFTSKSTATRTIPPEGETITKRVLKVGVRSCNVTAMHQRVFKEVMKYAEKLEVVVEIVAL